MRQLSKADILGQAALPMEAVEIPEWGGTVYVKTMSGTERDAFEASHLEAQKSAGHILANVRARLAVQTVCDAGGARLFADDDAAELGRKHGKALDRIFDVARRLNGLRGEDVKELEKN